MHPVYDYIVAVLILLMVLGFSFYAINSAVITQSTLAKEEQLKPIANRLFNKIFLTPGYPVNWGTNVFINESNLKDFGLLLAGEPHQIDVNKILRLNETNPLYIPPETFGNLTGLYQDGHWVYGFRLTIRSALNISIHPVDEYNNPPTTYLVHITDYTGKKASNAIVKGTVITLAVEKNGKYFTYELSTVVVNITNVDGTTLLKFNINQVSKPNANVVHMLLITANYYGIQSQVVRTFGENIATLISVGNYLIVNMTGQPIPSAEHVQLNGTAIEFTSDLNFILNPIVDMTKGEVGKIINKGRYNYRVYELANPITENVILVGLLIRKAVGGKGSGGPKYFLVVAARPPTPISVDYRSHSFNIAGIKTETLSGLFNIGDNTYYVELSVWRMSE